LFINYPFTILSMKRFILFFAVALFVSVSPSFAKGHGGGHGGGHHSSSRSSSGFSNYGNSRTSAATSRSTGASSRSSAVASAPAHISAQPIPVRKAAAGSSATTTGSGSGVAGSGNGYGYQGFYGSSYYPPEYYTAYYGYGYNPFFYDPFMMSFGTGFMFSPHYNYVSSPNDNSSGNEQETIANMPGYVVFENDTLKGVVTLTGKGVNVETTDQQQKYDYAFAARKEGLTYVTVYNTDSSQLNLVRVDDDSRRLYRVIHEGKLNLYDGRHKFIYQPEDIDIQSLYVVYNGEGSELRARSKEDAKIRLTQFVNKAYGLNLDSKDFTWKALLVYLDKLD